MQKENATRNTERNQEDIIIYVRTDCPISVYFTHGKNMHWE